MPKERICSFAKILQVIVRPEASFYWLSVIKGLLVMDDKLVVLVLNAALLVVVVLPWF